MVILTRRRERATRCSVVSLALARRRGGGCLFFRPAATSALPLSAPRASTALFACCHDLRAVAHTARTSRGALCQRRLPALSAPARRLAVTPVPASRRAGWPAPQSHASLARLCGLRAAGCVRGPASPDATCARTDWRCFADFPRGVVRRQTAALRVHSRIDFVLSAHGSRDLDSVRSNAEAQQRAHAADVGEQIRRPR